jgi:hypothetical protein
MPSTELASVNLPSIYPVLPVTQLLSVDLKPQRGRRAELRQIEIIQLFFSQRFTTKVLMGRLRVRVDSMTFC